MLIRQGNERLMTNQALFFSPLDSVYVMCFSLILLSVDLTSPHVKNKMSKREFIRNTRNAVVVDVSEWFCMFRGHSEMMSTKSSGFY